MTYARHARGALGMSWAMVAVTTAIYTLARLGRADGLTDDVRTVTARDPVSFQEFVHCNADLWRPANGVRPPS